MNLRFEDYTGGFCTKEDAVKKVSTEWCQGTGTAFNVLRCGDYTVGGTFEGKEIAGILISLEPMNNTCVLIIASENNLYLEGVEFNPMIECFNN